MKKILIATDFSENAKNALEAAMYIAQKSDTLLVLLHVINPEQFYTVNTDGEFKDASSDNNYKDHLLQIAGQRMEKLIEEYKLTNAIGKIEEGNIPKVIHEYVAKEEVDLLVIGTHGTSAYEEMLFGSNTDKIIRISPCPVLVMHQKAENFKLDNIILATDLKDNEENVMVQLKKIQELFQSTIHLVYINTPVNFYNTRRIQEMKDAFVAKYELKEYQFTIYDDYTAATGIGHFSDDIDADVIAIASHHFGDLLDQATSAHVTDVVVDETKRPVLAFHTN